MAVTKEEKQNLIKDIKRVSVGLSEAIKSDAWEDSYQLANKLKELWHSDILDDMTPNELAKEGLDELRRGYRGYWKGNGEMRKARAYMHKVAGTLGEVK